MGRNLKYKICFFFMKTSTKGFLQLNSFPNVRQIHDDPPLFMVDNFLSKNECKTLIAMSDKKVKTSQVVDAVTGIGVTHPARTSESCYYGNDLKWLISRVYRLTGVNKLEESESTVVTCELEGCIFPHPSVRKA